MFWKIVFLNLLLPKLYSVTSDRFGLEQTTENDETISLSPVEIDRIKAFLKTLNRFSEDKKLLKDPSSYCRSFDNCIDCVKSLWYPCGWCHNQGCTESPQLECPFAKTNSEISNITGEIKACPHIYNKGPILLPAGINMHIKIKIYLPDPIVYDKEVVCLIKFKKRHLHLKGLLLGDTVYCIPMIVRSELLEYGDTASGMFSVIWGGAQPYSNEIPLIVYSCETLAMDCETCRLIPGTYQCGWCERMQSCVVAEKCSDDLMKWTLSRLTCESYNKRLFYV